MGRAERRRAERNNRIEDRKRKILISKDELSKIRRETSDISSKSTVDALMTCFALAEHRLYGYGQKRLLRTLEYIDELMGGYVNGEYTIEDYKEMLKEEAGLVIKS